MSDYVRVCMWGTVQSTLSHTGGGARAEVCEAAWQAVRILHVVLEQLLNTQERWSIIDAVQHS